MSSLETRMIRSFTLALLAAFLSNGRILAQSLVTPTGDLPVIQKVSMVFSLVSHALPNWGNRASFYAQYDPSYPHVVPHLVCDPIITLYNPHPHPISLSSVRVRIWDPPVGFRFKKNGTYLRDEFTAGSFLGLARLQIQNESNASARKTFTFVLSDIGSNGQPGDPITLQSGETREFSPWIEPTWKWNSEISNAYVPYAFWDWDYSRDFTNRDSRTSNPMGTRLSASPQTGPGRQQWDPRAGFQWDHLSSQNSRPTGTYYPFELQRNWKTGYVAIRSYPSSDTFSVEATPLRVMPETGSLTDVPDFRLSLLAGLSTNPTQDIYQDFSFDIDQLTNHVTGDGIISRTLPASYLYQAANDFTPGGKSPFAVMTMIAKRESLVSGALEETGYFDGDQHYEARFDEAADFSSLEFIDENQTYVPFSTPPRLLDLARTDDGQFNFSYALSGGDANWIVMGGPSPDEMTTDLTGTAHVIPLPYSIFGPKLNRVSLDTSTLGDHYFIRLVEP